VNLHCVSGVRLTAITGIFDLCERNGVTVVIGGAYATGILATGEMGNFSNAVSFLVFCPR
jgi:hypothetical protein